MKLYATVTSERASKGQGGEWLDINVKDERGVTFAIIKVRKESGYFMPTLEIDSIGKVTEKGKKKPRTKYCTGCGACTMGEGWEDGKCDTCYEKGEKQKGEYHKCKKHEERTRECKFYSFQNDPCSEI